MKFKLAVLTAAIGLSLACDDGTKPFDTSDPEDTADTDVNGVADPPFITSVLAQCNGAGTAWEFEIESDNWMFDAAVWVFDTSFDPAWDEDHTLLPIEHSEFNGPQDPNAFDVWGATFADGATLGGSGNFDPNVNSVFDCDVHASFITFMFEAYNEDGSVADCVGVGHDPDEVISGSWPDNGASDVNGTSTARFSNCQNIN